MDETQDPRHKTRDTKPKKKRFKKRYWLLIDLVVVLVVLFLLLYTPAGYKPAVGYKRGHISPYLTNLSSEIYNGAQLQEPFEVVVIDEKLNEAVAGWSQASEDVVISAPAVLFVPDYIALMATAVIKGVELVATVGLEPEIDENGLLDLRLSKVKIGAVNITPLARIIARRMYEQQLAVMPADTEDWRTKLVGSLLNAEPFEPVFRVEDKKVRLKKVNVTDGKLELHLVPES